MTTSHTPVLTQDELKTLVGQAALQYVTPGTIVGVGTGSTVNKFIDALATIKDQIKGAVSSSEASTQRLKALGSAFHASQKLGPLIAKNPGQWIVLGQSDPLEWASRNKASYRPFTEAPAGIVRDWGERGGNFGCVKQASQTCLF